HTNRFASYFQVTPDFSGFPGASFFKTDDVERINQHLYTCRFARRLGSGPQLEGGDSRRRKSTRLEFKRDPIGGAFATKKVDKYITVCNDHRQVSRIFATRSSSSKASLSVRLPFKASAASIAPSRRPCWAM